MISFIRKLLGLCELDKRLHQFTQNLTTEQRLLDADMDAIMHDNLWNLYEHCGDVKVRKT